jgi:formate hydrogenlyase subunit 6/NADH:ubiquinone oxidoreductase subunit I
MGYFANIGEAIITIAKGMAITLRTFFKTPETIQYPDVDVLDPKMPGYHGHLKAVSERYRGFLTIETNSCIVDQACARVCPVDCIQMEGEKGPKTKAPSLIPGGKEMPKTRYLTRFDIHLGRCMYCGLCVEACPVGAIHFTREFRGATGNYKDLIRRCIPEEEAERVRKMAQEEAAKEKETKPEKKSDKAEGEDQQ